MLHFTARNRVGQDLRLLLITLVLRGTDSLIATATMGWRQRQYHDSRMEASAPTKKVSLRKSGTFPR